MKENSKKKHIKGLRPEACTPQNPYGDNKSSSKRNSLQDHEGKKKFLSSCSISSAQRRNLQFRTDKNNRDSGQGFSHGKEQRSKTETISVRTPDNPLYISGQKPLRRTDSRIHIPGIFHNSQDTSARQDGKPAAAYRRRLQLLFAQFRSYTDKQIYCPALLDDMLMERKGRICNHS